jgi:hypothetical protein
MNFAPTAGESLWRVFQHTLSLSITRASSHLLGDQVDVLAVSRRHRAEFLALMDIIIGGNRRVVVGEVFLVMNVNPDIRLEPGRETSFVCSTEHLNASFGGFPREIG